MSFTEDPTVSLPPCPLCGESVFEKDQGCPHRADASTLATGAPSASYTGPKEIAGYRILRELGSGGMGTVYEAYEERMSRKVALKVLSTRLASSVKGADRFAQEAWIAGKLNHPNLVKVYERGSWKDVDFYSMELVGGGSLADVIHNLKHGGRDENWGLEFGTHGYVHWAATQIIAAAKGLDYAHRQGVVHRDIKPMNLLLSRELGTTKIADFGLAIDVDTTRLTTDGRMLGTLAYMAPEQILGKQGEIDPRTDVYALGVTLFELLTLELPYTGDTQQLYMNAVLKSEARRPSKLNQRVSRDLEIVIRKALEKDRRDRYSSAAAFAEDVENVLALKPITAHPPSVPAKILKWARRKPVHAALAGALIIGLPVVGVLTHQALEHQTLLRQMRVEGLVREIKRMSQKNLRHDETFQLASEILRIDPRNLHALRARAISYMYLSQSASGPGDQLLEEKSLADISKLIDAHSSSSWPYRLQSFVLSRLGRAEEAREVELRSLRYRSDPPSDDDLFFDGLLANDAGDHEQAVALLTGLIVRRPGWSDAILSRGDAFGELGNIDRAINDYRLATALDPGNYLLYSLLGQKLTQSGSLEEGGSYLQRAVELAPEIALAHERLSDNYLELGRAATSDGDRVAAGAHFGKAEEEARKALELEPDGPWSHLNLGASLMEQNRALDAPNLELIGEATDHYTQALIAWQGRETDEETGGAYVNTLFNQCDALIQLRDLERALKICMEVTELDPEAPDAHYNLAGVYALMNRPAEAFRALEIDFELGDRDHGYLASDRWFESLRDDPRFNSLIERMKEAAVEPDAR